MKQHNINKSIEEFIEEKQETGKSYTKEDLVFINQYMGSGGLAKQGATGKGLLSEFYTPEWLVAHVMGLAINKYGLNIHKDKVLEPSCGTGRFLRYLSPQMGSNVVGIELNPVSAEIARANHPTFNIQNKYFNELFIDRYGNSQDFPPIFDFVIGNPPYGSFIGKFSAKERGFTKAKQYEEYFITRGLDVLEEGGILIYIVPSTYIDGKLSPVREAIHEKGKLLDAWRLPKRVFPTTDVQTDIVVYQKK